MASSAAVPLRVSDPPASVPDVRLVAGGQPGTITINKIGSVTRGLLDVRTVRLSAGGPVQSGDLVVVQAIDEKRVYGQLELANGRLAHVARGDVLAGVLGSRNALKGLVGACPSEVRVDDTLHMLNLGGVIGLATSANPDFGPPLRVRVLGLVERDGAVVNIAEGAIPSADSLVQPAPLVVVAGTCMAAGKTQAACEVAARLAGRGLRVGAVKLSGVAAQRDSLSMLDHGATVALSFLDAGLPSTADIDDLAPMAKGLLNAVTAEGVDVVLVEMGDGIIGGYGVQSFYADTSLRAATAAHVMCANDLVAAWGAAQLAVRLGRPIDVMSGPVTDNEVGERYVETELGIPAANARTRPDRLAELVFEQLATVRVR
jgi:hypothetical protein